VAGDQLEVGKSGIAAGPSVPDHDGVARFR
jgi:hypothetical protein